MALCRAACCAAPCARPRLPGRQQAALHPACVPRLRFVRRTAAEGGAAANPPPHERNAPVVDALFATSADGKLFLSVDELLESASSREGVELVEALKRALALAHGEPPLLALVASASPCPLHFRSPQGPFLFLQSCGPAAWSQAGASPAWSCARHAARQLPLSAPPRSAHVMLLLLGYLPPCCRAARP